MSFDGRIGLEGYAPADLRADGARPRHAAAVSGRRALGSRYRSCADGPCDRAGPRGVGDRAERRMDDDGSIQAETCLTSGAAQGKARPSLRRPLRDNDMPPVRLDVRVIAPGTLRIENHDANIVSSADLTFRGTYERPIVFGSVEVSRGEFIFEGRRYVVTRGRLDFTNPVRIEPTFDIAAETQVRVPQQTYRITLSASGTKDRLRPVFSSDPPLPQVDVASLLFADLGTGQDADLRALSRPDLTEQQLVQARVARMLVSPISGADRRGGRTDLRRRYVPADAARERSVAKIDALQPLGTPHDRQAHLEPRVFDVLAQHQLDKRPDHPAGVLQTDRISWILTRNEDASYALDIRVRKEF